MLQRLKEVFGSVHDWLAVRAARLAGAAGSAARAGAGRTLPALDRGKRGLVALGVLGVAGYALYTHPPMVSVGRGEMGVRENRLTGAVSEWRDGSVFVLPGLHDMRVYSAARPDATGRSKIRRADGPAPLQSRRGPVARRRSGGALRARRRPGWRACRGTCPTTSAREIVEPAVQGVIYKIFARYTVREIFSTKRVEIQQAIETELTPKLAADGVVLRGVQMGKVDLPADYRRGMDGLLAEELATEKMRYTLELKDKRVKEIGARGRGREGAPREGRRGRRRASRSSPPRRRRRR